MFVVNPILGDNVFALRLGLTSLKELQMTRCRVTDAGIAHLEGRTKKNFIILYIFQFFHVSSSFLYCSILISCFIRVITVNVGIITFLNAGLTKLALLNLEGCPVTAACLEYISGIYTLIPYLILSFLSRCFCFL